MPVTAGAFITSVCINGSLGLLCFSAFAVLRKWSVTAKLYKPKRFTGAENVNRRKPPPLPAELPSGLLSWIGPVWKYPETDVINLCGLDVAVFFRLLNLGVRLFTYISLWSLLVVMPINYKGGYLDRPGKHRRPNGTTPPAATLSAPQSWPAASTTSSSSGGGSGGSEQAWLLQAPVGLSGLGNFSDAIHTNLDLLTLSNLPPGSRMMWVHLTSVYLVTFVALKLLWNLSRDVAFKRAVYLAVSGGDGATGSSVLVSDLPGLEWGTPLQRLRLSWVQRLLPASWSKEGYHQGQQQQQQQQLTPGLGSSRSSSGSSNIYNQQRHRQQKAELTLRQPLLEAADQQQQQQHAGDVTDKEEDAPAGDDFQGDVGVTVAAAADHDEPGQAAASSHEDQRRQQQQQQQDQQQDQQPLGPPIMQDVWSEAVECLQHNGGNVQAMVEQEMRKVYGSDSVAAVALSYETASLDAAAARFKALQEQFEDVLDWYQYKLPPQQADLENAAQQQQQQQRGKRQHHGKPGTTIRRKMVLVVGPRYGAWGIERYGVTPTKVDALEFYPAVLQQQLSELQQLRRAAHENLPRPAAVVTFRGQLMATLAAASLHSYDETAWTITPAPKPDEVVWPSLGLRTWELSVRYVAVWVAFWALVLFYAPVVALIQAPVNMDNLKKIPFLATLLNLPLVSSLVQGFLPSLVLVIFLAVLPSLLLSLIHWAALHSIAAQDAQLIGMYFLFQLFAVFIFSFVSGTALSQLQALIDDPHRIVSLLGVSAPQQASFFSTYILLLGLSRTPLQLLRLPQLAIYLLRLQLADSPRQRKRLWANQQNLLGYYLPLHTLVLQLGLVFCIAAPLIAPVTLLYFVSSSICQRYQWLYVFTHAYDGAGMLWRQVFSQVLVGVYFFIAVMGCLLGIKRFEGALLLLPLAAGVVIFHVLAGKLLVRPLTLPASKAAAAMDHYIAEAMAAAAAAAEKAGAGGGSSSSGNGGSSQGQPGRGNVPQLGDVPAKSAVAVAAQKSAGELAGLPDQAGSIPQPLNEDDLHELYLPPAMKIRETCLQPLLEEAAEVQRRLRSMGC